MTHRRPTLSVSHRARRGDWAPRVAFTACAVAAVALVVFLLSALAVETAAFLRDVPLGEFVGGLQWAPFFEEPRFGVLPLLAASLQVTLGACFVAVPTGLLVAVYLQEYATPHRRRIMRLAVDLLAGIPTVVYGYFALTFVTPLLQAIWPGTEVFNWASAALVVGLMIVPTVTSLSTDALSRVAPAVREAAFGLGASRAQVATRVLIPAASPGIVAAVVLATARAVGETMTVTLAAGNQARFALNPLEGVQTMTAFIAQVSLGDAPTGTVEYRTIFAVGTVLFLLTFALNGLARRTLRRRGSWVGAAG